VIGSVFRAVSYLTPNQVIAQQLGGPVTVMTFLFGGFLITEGKIPNFLIEFFWISPFSWLVRSLANNEFNDSRYSQLVSQSGQPGGQMIRRGDSFMEFW